MTTIQAQEWHNSGSACCSPIGTCCLAHWCPCILYGRTSYRKKNSGNMDGYSCCNTSCAGFCVLLHFGVGFILPMISRGDVRAKYHLKGNGCTDCLCSCCCLPCDLVQQDKEVAYREEQKQPFLAQPGKESAMSYQPQQQQPQFHHG